MKYVLNWYVSHCIFITGRLEYRSVLSVLKISHTYVTMQGEDWVLCNPYLLPSISTDKVWQSLLSGTPVSVAGYTISVAIQAKKVNKN